MSRIISPKERLTTVCHVARRLIVCCEEFDHEPAVANEYIDALDDALEAYYKACEDSAPPRVEPILPPYEA